ncbi:MAG: hypothetical protein GDA48_21870 [Hormoscilla sp. GM102CHS1]|nr:hypothetical protein [Hormoscilla sp. GM102CHS1]
MEIIEFKTIPQNGSVTIPPEYSAQWEGKNIRVILLDDEGNLALPMEQPPTPSFKTISLSTRGFKFNRDSANAR